MKESRYRLVITRDDKPIRIDQHNVQFDFYTQSEADWEAIEVFSLRLRQAISVHKYHASNNKEPK